MTPLRLRPLIPLTICVFGLGLSQVPAAPAEKQKWEAASPSTRIDWLVGAGYREHDVKAYPITSDEVFVRRIYLDTIGRIPTRAEVQDFLADEHPKKRDRLIDSLLESDGYVHHFYNFWADLLRAKTQLTGAGQSRASGHAYSRWIKDALSQNLPYDHMVAELLTAEGKSWENGAVGFYIRDYGMALDQMAVTTQVFLGTQVVCAQCHDHPFDTWKQLDYYQLAAYSFGSYASNNPPLTNQAAKLYAKKKSPGVESGDLRRAFSEILKPVRFNNVYHSPRLPRLPHDYQYDNGKPKEAIKPAIPGVIGATTVQAAEGERPVEAYARWMTSPQNPRFTKVIANRLWKKAMGLGVIEPVDEFTEQTEAANPALMAYLERLMVEVDYDMRRYLAAIFKSKTYQREAHGGDILAGLPYHFPGPVLRRMSAEQIWDSLFTLVDDAPDATSGRFQYQGDRFIAEAEWTANAIYDQKPGEFVRNGLQIAALQRELAGKMSAASLKLQEAREEDDSKAIRAASKEVSELRRALVLAIEKQVYSKGFREKVELVSAEDFGGCEEDEFLRDLQQTLNDGKVDMGSSDNPMREGVKMVLRGKLAAAMKQENLKEIREKKDWGVEKEDEKVWARFDEKRDRLARAAEIPSPAPPGHFLREFGQSDRDIVNNSNDGASVTQSLGLLNGQILDAVFHRYSALSRDVKIAKTPGGMIDRVYLNILSRRATAEERKLLLPLFAKGGDGTASAVHQVVWSLLNTRQFLFVQ